MNWRDFCGEAGRILEDAAINTEPQCKFEQKSYEINSTNSR
jgi:hypothetical protein